MLTNKRLHPPIFNSYISFCFYVTFFAIVYEDHKWNASRFHFILHEYSERLLAFNLGIFSSGRPTDYKLLKLFRIHLFPIYEVQLHIFKENGSFPQIEIWTLPTLATFYYVQLSSFSSLTFTWFSFKTRKDSIQQIFMVQAQFLGAGLCTK